MLVENIEMTWGELDALNLNFGDEKLFDFKYSVRSAKLFRDETLDEIKEISGENIAVYYDTHFSKPVPVENGNFIYYLPVEKSEETSLPGLKVGDRNFVENYGSIKRIEKYTLL